MNLRQFIQDRRGNAAMILAITMVPVAGLVAGTVEYTRTANQWSQLQTATDSAALRLTLLPTTTSQTDLNTQASSIVRGMVSDPAVRSSLSVTVTRTTSSIKVAAAGNVQTPFTSLIGHASRPVSVDSTAVRSAPRLRVSLILDLTGSMADDGKFQAMQPAARNLLAQLQNGTARDGDTYVSIVPFRRSVNVGAANLNQSWVRFNGQSDTWDERNGRCSNTSHTTKVACNNAGKTWTAANHASWNGCVMDRDMNYDVSNAPVDGSSGSRYPAYQDAQCPPQVIPMTYNWTALNNLVNTMKPASGSAGTSQPIGFAHAWNTFGGSIYPYPAEDPTYQYNHAIVMLSDGLNTINRWWDVHVNASDDDKIDAREKIICDRIKAAGITIYSVHINTGGDPTSAVLRYCASGADKFWHVTAAGQTNGVLKQIGNSLIAVGSPRLTQ